jgi:hypothetical protein
VDKLKTVLFQWSGATCKLTYYGKKDIYILKEYLKHHHDYYLYDQFENSFELLPSISNLNLSQISDESLLYKSFNLFSKAIWPVRFNSKFVARLNDYGTEQIYLVLGYVYYLAMGNFGTKTAMQGNYGYVRALAVKSIHFNRFFVVKIFKEKNMFVHVGVEKIPIVKGGVIKRY